MLKLTSVFLSLAFFIWIQPLGAFIQPSDEDKVCGGKRAVHQCMMNMMKQLKKPVLPDDYAGPKISAAGTTTAKSSPSGGGNDYVKLQDLWVDETFFQKINLFSINSHRFLFLKSIEHIPKL